MKTILGIDPGFERCGYAVLEQKKQVLSLRDFGVIRTSPSFPFPDRLHEIGQDITTLLKEHKPDIISIEDLFFVQNITTGLRVAEVRGMILYLAKQNACTILQPKPVEIKQSFTGNGKASKAEMAKMASLHFDLPQKGILDDAIDAIAAGFFATTRR